MRAMIAHATTPAPPGAEESNTRLRVHGRSPGAFPASALLQDVAISVDRSRKQGPPRPAGNAATSEPTRRREGPLQQRTLPIEPATPVRREKLRCARRPADQRSCPATAECPSSVP